MKRCRCEKCGIRFKTLDSVDCQSVLHKCTPGRKYLGDRVADILERYGVTEESYKRFKAEHGMDPECNCKERREWLNRLDRWARGLLG